MPNKNIFLIKMNHVRRQSFKPNLYTSSNNINQSVPQSDDEIIIKGENFKYAVNMNLLEEYLEHFKNQPNLKIHELSGSDREKFNTIVSHVQLLFNTPFYKKLYEKVECKFSNLEHVQPGTIGGYMSGCLVKSKFPGNPNCSPLCLNGIPNPKNLETHGPCSDRIIMAEYVTDSEGKSGYIFTSLKSGPDNHDSDEHTILYTNCKNIHDFKGFTPNEKDILYNMNVSNVQLYFMDSHTYSSIMNIHDIKTNKGTPVIAKEGKGMGLFLIIIIVILILLFLGWKFMSNKKY